MKATTQRLHSRRFLSGSTSVRSDLCTHVEASASARHHSAHSSRGAGYCSGCGFGSSACGTIGVDLTDLPFGGDGDGDDGALLDAGARDATPDGETGSGNGEGDGATLDAAPPDDDGDAGAMATPA